MRECRPCDRLQYNCHLLGIPYLFHISFQFAVTCKQARNYPILALLGFRKSLDLSMNFCAHFCPLEFSQAYSFQCIFIPCLPSSRESEIPNNDSGSYEMGKIGHTCKPFHFPHRLCQISASVLISSFQAVLCTV